jgi:hypothetical protein
MRENCVRIAAFAARTGLYGPLFLLFTALLMRVFGRTDALEITWEGDTMYIRGPRPPAPASERVPRPARTPSSAQRPDSAPAPADTPSRITRRPVERPPKSALEPQNTPN